MSYNTKQFENSKHLLNYFNSQIEFNTKKKEETVNRIVEQLSIVGRRFKYFDLEYEISGDACYNEFTEVISVRRLNVHKDNKETYGLDWYEDIELDHLQYLELID
jgi:hypothetical protein